MLTSHAPEWKARGRQLGECELNRWVVEATCGAARAMEVAGTGTNADVGWIAPNRFDVH